MHVLKKFIAEEIEVQRVTSIGGKQIQTAADMICTKVEEYDTYYRCYMRTEDAQGRKIKNCWKANDQALCKTFNLEKQNGKLGNHYYWRLVVNVKDDYIDLSKSVCALYSDIPLVDDNIVQLGYQGTDDPTRQTAQILAGAGEGAPYIKQYEGINGFSLPLEYTRLKPGDNMLSGVVNLQNGSKGATNLIDLQVGGENILKNSGWTGSFDFAKVEPSTSFFTDSKLYSPQLELWDGTATIIDEQNAKSGKAANITSLSQNITLINDESYVVNFFAKGSSITIVCGSYSETLALTSEYKNYVCRFNANNVNSLSISGGTIYDLKLERGTIPTVWCPNVSDNDPSVAKLKELNVFTHAIKEASTSFIGGMGLMEVLMMGMYSNGVMQKVTAGISGVYSDDYDVAFWGGGTLQQAIALVTKFRNNPQYNPTTTEWNNLAKFVVTHGGDVFIRGYIYAEGGYFRGRVDLGNYGYLDPYTRKAKLGKLFVNEDGLVSCTDLLFSVKTFYFNSTDYFGYNTYSNIISDNSPYENKKYSLVQGTTINGVTYNTGDVFMYTTNGWKYIDWMKIYLNQVSDATEATAYITLNPSIIQNIEINVKKTRIGEPAWKIFIEPTDSINYLGTSLDIITNYCERSSTIFLKDDKLKIGGYDRNGKITLTATKNGWLVEGGFSNVSHEKLLVAAKSDMGNGHFVFEIKSLYNLDFTWETTDITGKSILWIPKAFPSTILKSSNILVNSKGCYTVLDSIDFSDTTYNKIIFRTYSLSPFELADGDFYVIINNYEPIYVNE
jgi:hypothetical protein